MAWHLGTGTVLRSLMVMLCVWFLCEDIWLIFRRIIKAKFLHPKDLQPGMAVSCEIKEHIQNGAFVVIDGDGKSLKGFVRSLHLGNVPLQHPEKKFPVGSQHPARVRPFLFILKSCNLSECEQPHKFVFSVI
jgi:hypothetical protein